MWRAAIAHISLTYGVQWSGPTLTHKSFESDLAFGPDVGNDEVYQRSVVANDVSRVQSVHSAYTLLNAHTQMLTLALSSGIACILAYGQTGAGKTYTIEALEHRISRDLFVAAKQVGAQLLRAEEQAQARSEATEDKEKNTMPTDPADVFEFKVTFLELLGKRAVDLLEPVEGLALDAAGNPIRKEVPIHEDKVSPYRPGSR